MGVKEVFCFTIVDCYLYTFRTSLLLWAKWHVRALQALGNESTLVGITLADVANRRQELAVHDNKQRARQRKRAQLGYTDDLNSTEEEGYDLCYDNVHVSNRGATRHLEYDNSEYEKMRQQYCSGSQYENVTDFSNVH